jgi:pyruvate dehydrogenase E2 component (dihydrolipoamide acetyltransferase)
VNINVAVNTDRGLFTPLISQTDNKGLVEINKQTKDLAEKAKAGKLGATELEVRTLNEK